MKTSARGHLSVYPLVESLEGRQLLSAALPMGTVALISPIAVAPPTSSTSVLTGTSLHAETGQAFRAIIGSIRGLPALPTGYSLQGAINWGDGSHSSAAFVRQADGAIAVLGTHNYSDAGTDDIEVTVAAVPPAGSTAPVRLIGSFHSKAGVIAPNGGVTLSQTVGISFSANLGFFHSTLPASSLNAIITWGDGTQSAGKIVALPTASPVPTFAVFGAHNYASIASYPVHITVFASSPTATPTATGTPPIVLVTQIDSVIDVLPVLPTITGV